MVRRFRLVFKIINGLDTGVGVGYTYPGCFNSKEGGSMNKYLAVLASFLAVFLFPAFTAQAQWEYPREQVRIERSPFGSAEFRILFQGKVYRDAVEAGKMNGRAAWSDQPSGELYINFGEIVQEMNRAGDDAKLISRWGLTTQYSYVEVRVDRNAKGMLISYERYGLWPNRVVVTVPLEEDKRMWEDMMKIFSEAYRNAFFDRNKSERKKDESRERAKQERIERLQKGPMPVFPHP